MRQRLATARSYWQLSAWKIFASIKKGDLMKRIIYLFISFSFLLGFSQGDASQIHCQSLEEIAQKGVLNEKTMIFIAKLNSQKRADTADAHILEYYLEEVNFLQGNCACLIKKAIYQQPVLMKKINGKIFGVSLSLPCSGKEFNLENGKNYIFFANSPCEEDKLVRLFRIEPIENKDQVISAIKSAKQPILWDEQGNFILYVSNQSFAVNPVDIKIYIDGKIAIDEKFDLTGKRVAQHNWKQFRFKLKPGRHYLKAASDKGKAALEKEFEIKNKHWAVVDYWNYPKVTGGAGPTPASFSFRIQDTPIGFE
jgi:hypothetical protein